MPQRRTGGGLMIGVFEKGDWEPRRGVPNSRRFARIRNHSPRMPLTILSNSFIDNSLAGT